MKIASLLLLSTLGVAQKAPPAQLTTPRPLQRIGPEYSEEARAAKLQGTVTVYVELNELGIPEKVEVLQGLGLGLDEKAIVAVKQSTFKPGTRDGAPVRSALTARIGFQLPEMPLWRITRAAYVVQLPAGMRTARQKTKPVLTKYLEPSTGVCADTKKIAELQLTIDATGIPHLLRSADVVDDSPTIREAMEAVEAWRYQPATLEGKPVSADAMLELECDPTPVPGTVEINPLQAGKDIPAPVIVSRTQPEYTEEARAAGINGYALYMVGIDMTGRVVNVSSFSTIGYGADESVMDALLSWRFRPPMKDGKPVTAWERMSIHVAPPVDPPR
jgi:TonB family protein